ncbi:hypothetical protein Zmor_000274 [Zophobas morio]|uniref:acid phosphatase n=1 Tax=Zophobas morio TaxID=2755281 RepID=A0AA38J0J1_9CUCU|nr:hypothetical protein Zmor_000274 [Zophobas morio]
MSKILIFVLLLLNTIAKLNLTEKNTLELVHVIFRHGDRTPDKELIYPNDPHINVSYYPADFGQHTNTGKMKQYLLGQALRKRYKNFLGPYKYETAYARSTQYPRTKISLQLVLAALFPPEGALVWNKNLKWQPIAFDYWPMRNDHVLGQPYKNCPRYKKLYLEFLNSTQGRKLFENYSETIDYLSEHTGLNITSRQIYELYFTLDLEKENGLELPQWTQSVFPDVLYDLLQLDYFSKSATHELRRLSSGFLLKKIIRDTRNKIRGILPENRKIFLYSGHEFTITFLMHLWGVFYPHLPPYSAYILIEIHNVGGIRRMKIFYQDYLEEKPKQLKLPHCGHFCSFNDFTELYQKYLPKSKRECDI